MKKIIILYTLFNTFLLANRLDVLNIVRSHITKNIQHLHKPRIQKDDGIHTKKAHKVYRFKLKAFKLYKKALKIDKNKTNIYYNMANLSFFVDKFNAKKYYLLAKEKCKTNDPDIYFNYFVTSIIFGKAVPPYDTTAKKLLKKYPNYLPVIKYLRNYYIDEKKYKQADKYSKIVIKKEKNIYNMLKHLHIILSLKDFKKANKYLLKLEKNYKNEIAQSSFYYHSAIMIHDKLKNKKMLEKIISAYKAHVKKNPSESFLCYELIINYFYDNKEYKKALKSCLDFEEINSSMFIEAFKIKIYFKLKDYKNCIKIYEKAAIKPVITSSNLNGPILNVIYAYQQEKKYLKAASVIAEIQQNTKVSKILIFKKYTFYFLHYSQYLKIPFFILILIVLFFYLKNIFIKKTKKHN